MMVLDTSAWIEMLLGSQTGLLLKKRIKDGVGIIVPTIVQLELAKWALREDGEKKAEELVAYTSEFHVADLTTAIASLAATLAREHKLHTTDAIIYTTTQVNESLLLTCDAHFTGLPGVEYYEK